MESIIYTHPDNIEELKKHTEKIEDGIYRPFAFKVIEEPMLPKERDTGRVRFKQERFIEYEQSDRQWALYFGYAERIMEKVFYKIDNKYAHFGNGIFPIHSPLIINGF